MCRFVTSQLENSFKFIQNQSSHLFISQSSSFFRNYELTMIKYDLLMFSYKYFRNFSYHLNVLIVLFYFWATNSSQNPLGSSLVHVSSGHQLDLLGSVGVKVFRKSVWKKKQQKWNHRLVHTANSQTKNT